MIRLGGAQISGAFFLDNADLGHEPSDEQDRRPILQLNHATINDGLWTPGLKVRGQIRLAGTTVTGAVNLDDADLNEPTDTVIDAESLTSGWDWERSRFFIVRWKVTRRDRLGGLLHEYTQVA